MSSALPASWLDSVRAQQALTSTSSLHLDDVPNLDAPEDAARAFCRAVLPEDGHLCVLGLQKGSPPAVRWVNTSDACAAVCLDLDRTARMDAYVAIANYTSRGTRIASNVARKKSLYVDIDVGAGKPYASKEEALQSLSRFCDASGIPMPGIAIDSGNGIHAYWPFDGAISPEEWIPLAESLKNACELVGLHADASVTADLTRVLRVPGTHNHKTPANPLLVRLLWIRSPHDVRLLSRALLQHRVAPQFNQSGSDKNDDLTGGIPSSTAWFDQFTIPQQVAELDRMLATLPASEAHERESWIRTLAEIASAEAVPWDLRVQSAWTFSTRSTKSRNESPESVAALMKGLGSRTNVTALRRRAEAYGYSGPAPARDAPFATKHDAEVGLAATYLHVAELDMYLHRPSRQLVQKASIKDAETWRMPCDESGRRYDALSVLRASRHVTRCRALGFHPGAPDVYEEDGHLVANIFRPYTPQPIPPTFRETLVLGRLIRHLFPRGADRAWLDHLLDTLAFLATHPGQRVPYAMTLVGAIEGSGKSTLMEQIPRRLFGPANVVTVSCQEVESQFTDWLAQAWIVVVAEISVGTHRNAARIMNTLKDNITNPTLRLHEKGQRGRSQRNRVSFFATSNDEDHALHLGTHDRRFSVCATRAGTLPSRIAGPLYRFIDSPRCGGVLRYFAEHRDLSGFDPNRTPPLTSAKERMISSSREPIHEELVAAWEDRERPFDKDLVALQDVVGCLIARRAETRGLSPQRLGRMLSLPPIGARRIEHQVKVGASSARQRLWIVRNADTWKSASAGAIGAHLLSAPTSRTAPTYIRGGPRAEQEVREPLTIGVSHERSAAKETDNG
jgi:Family of unknown function (DUF5906)